MNNDKISTNNLIREIGSMRKIALNYISKTENVYNKLLKEMLNEDLKSNIFHINHKNILYIFNVHYFKKFISIKFEGLPFVFSNRKTSWFPIILRRDNE